MLAWFANPSWPSGAGYDNRCFGNPLLDRVPFQLHLTNEFKFARVSEFLTNRR